MSGGKQKVGETERKQKQVEWSRGEVREKAEGMGCSKDKVERVEKMQ
jgi:hypothetical protein